MLPVLLFLIAGGADLTRSFFVGIQIADAARQAALYAANNAGTYDQAQLQTVAVNNAGSGPLVCPTGDLRVTLGATYSDGALPSDPLLTQQPYFQPVVVTCSLPLLTPLLPSPVTIRTTATALVLPA